MKVVTIVLIYLFIGFIVGLIVELLARIPNGSSIAEELGDSLSTRIAVVLGWPIVVFGVIIGLIAGDDGTQGPTQSFQ